MKYPFEYSLFDKDCKKQTGVIKASCVSRGKTCLRIRFPKATKIKLKPLKRGKYKLSPYCEYT